MLEVRDPAQRLGEALVVRWRLARLSRRARSSRCSAVTAWARRRLIRSIMGLAPPQVRSGSISWRGENLVGLRPHDIAGRKIAIVPAGAATVPVADGDRASDDA